MRESLAIVQRTVEAASDVAAPYVVVHFPSSYVENSRIPPLSGQAERIRQAGLALSQLSESTGIQILVENMSFNPNFGTAEDYCGFLSAFPLLGMCLDLGHAHISRHAGDVYTFTSAVAPFVRSVHLYNTQRNCPTRRHSVPSPEKRPDDGWMDLPRLLDLLGGCGCLEFVVFEYILPEVVPTAQGDQSEGDSCIAKAWQETDWLRQIISGMKWST
jgi:sugar phosphate isomerase/epimerase